MNGEDREKDIQKRQRRQTLEEVNKQKINGDIQKKRDCNTSKETKGTMSGCVCISYREKEQQ